MLKANHHNDTIDAARVTTLAKRMQSNHDKLVASMAELKNHSDPVESNNNAIFINLPNLDDADTDTIDPAKLESIKIRLKKDLKETLQGYRVLFFRSKEAMTEEYNDYTEYFNKDGLASDTNNSRGKTIFLYPEDPNDLHKEFVATFYNNNTTDDLTKIKISDPELLSFYAYHIHDTNFPINVDNRGESVRKDSYHKISLESKYKIRFVDLKDKITDSFLEKYLQKLQELNNIKQTLMSDLFQELSKIKQTLMSDLEKFDKLLAKESDRLNKLHLNTKVMLEHFNVIRQDLNKNSTENSMEEMEKEAKKWKKSSKEIENLHSVIEKLCLCMKENLSDSDGYESAIKSAGWKNAIQKVQEGIVNFVNFVKENYWTSNNHTKSQPKESSTPGLGMFGIFKRMNEQKKSNDRAFEMLDKGLNPEIYARPTYSPA